jgi:hypothetical protein
MHREIIIACLPYLLAILASVCVLRLLVSASGARLDLSRLRSLHRDQAGGVQSLSFVLTLPLFIMVMMFIVQLSQITIGRIVVEYAAFAAARSAIVWIPANLGPGDEQENRISRYEYLQDVEGDDGNIYSEYAIEPDGHKFDRIHFAAAMACMPVCPSRDVGSRRDHPGNAAAPAIIKMYRAYAPGSTRNPRIPDRLRNKLTYALNNTRVEILVRHKDEEPELAQHNRRPYPDEFTFNEIGWQDQIMVTVRHDYALLPGPGRLLARPTDTGGQSSSSGTTDAVAQRITRYDGAFVYPLSATVRLNNEGEKPVLPYIQRINQGAAGFTPYEPDEPYEPPDYDDDDYEL